MPVVPATSHTCGANGASAPAPRGPWPSRCCCQPDSNTGGIQRQVTTLPSPFSTGSYPFLSHTLHRPFIPHALTLNYFHTKSVYSLPEPLELASKGLIGRTHSVFQVPHTLYSVLTTRNITKELYLTLEAATKNQTPSIFSVALAHFSSISTVKIPLCLRKCDHVTKFSLTCFLYDTSVIGSSLHCRNFCFSNLFCNVLQVYSREINLLTPNVNYSGRTAPLTSKVAFLYMYSTSIVTEYFKHGVYSPFFLFKMQFVL